MKPVSDRRRRVVTVGPLDVLHARSRITTVIGPVRTPDPGRIADRVAAMVAAGPHTRIGLRPDTGTTRWEYDPGLLPDIVVADPPASPEDLLVGPHAADDVGAPTRIVLAGDHILTDHNHGLGEVELTLMFHAVVLGTIDAHDPRTWQAACRRGSGIPTAAARVFGSDPRRLFALRRRTHGPAVPDTGDTGDTVPWTPARSGAVGTFDRTAVRALRNWRDRHEPAASMFSVTTVVLHRALCAAGIAPAPTITVPFDARRYLPPGCTPLGNFVAGLDFTVGTAPTPTAVNEAVSRAASAGRPVANLALNALRTRIASAQGIQARPPRSRPRVPRARMLFSSIGQVPRHGGIPWLDPTAAGRPFYAAHNDPTGPEGITFTCGVVDGRTIAVASFHENVFPADAVADAMAHAAAEPLAYLAAGARADP